MRSRVPSFAYIATPFTLFHGGLDEAWKEACRVTAEFIRRGVPVYSPIAHTHPVAIHGGIDPVDHALWMKADQAMMESASDLYVIQMPGWNESKGIEMEIEAFRKASKPITYFTWPMLRELADEVRT